MVSRDRLTSCASLWQRFTSLSRSQPDRPSITASTMLTRTGTTFTRRPYTIFLLRCPRMPGRLRVAVGLALLLGLGCAKRAPARGPAPSEPAPEPQDEERPGASAIA